MINPLRGEANFVLAGNTYVLAMTMESLAHLSLTMNDPPVDEFYQRLMRGALGMQRAALSVFVQSGTTADGKPMKRRDAIATALRDLALSDLAAWTSALVPLLEAVTRKPGDGEADDSGNRVAAQG